MIVARLILLLLCLPVPLAFAQFAGGGARAPQAPTPYGLKYFRADQVAQISPEVQELRSAPLADDFRLAVEQAELEGGPYGAGLAEVLLAEAYYLAERGDLAGAIASARRGIHVQRINEGLHDRSLMPVLDQLIDWYMATGDLEVAGDAVHYRAYLAQQIWPASSVEAIAARVANVDWMRKLWLDNTAAERKRINRLYREIESQRLDLLEDPLADPVSVQQLSYAQLGLIYAVGEAEFGAQVDFANNYGRGYGSDPLQQPSIEDRQLGLLQSSALQRGRSVLENLVQWLRANANDDALLGDALLQLGDWFIWHDFSARATPHYLEARQLLVDSPLLFSEPLELPSLPWFYRGERWPGQADSVNAITVDLSVSAQGRVTAATPKSVPATATVAADRLSRWLREARYRPRLVEDVPAATEGFERTYRVRY